MRAAGHVGGTFSPFSLFNLNVSSKPNPLVASEAVQRLMKINKIFIIFD